MRLLTVYHLNAVDVSFALAKALQVHLAVAFGAGEILYVRVFISPLVE